MSFNRDEVADLLVKCHRRCAICHRFCGTKIETDHIIPAADNGDDSVDNAIPVCFECHAEIHTYNPRHPRGRRFTPDELRGHKQQWLTICAQRPEVLVEAARNVDIGPLQGLLDEMDYNLVVSADVNDARLGFLFRDEQITRAIREGVLSTLEDGLRNALSEAYGAVSRANEAVRGFNLQNTSDFAMGTIANRALKLVQAAVPRVEAARDMLLAFVRSESSADGGGQP